MPTKAAQPRLKTIMLISLLCLTAIAASIGLKGSHDFWAVVLFIVGSVSVASAWIYYFFYDDLSF